MSKMIFVNLPVADLAAAKAFYEAIGFTNNPQFTDETAACMVLTDTIHVMLLTHEKFAQFTPKRIADAQTTSEVLICISADSREGVDAITEKALAAGGKRAAREAGLRLHVRPQLRGSGRPYLGADVDGHGGRDRGDGRARNGDRLNEMIPRRDDMAEISNETPTLTPHIVCAGAAEAIEFYKTAFGAEELIRIPGEDGKLMHAAISIDGIDADAGRRE